MNGFVLGFGLASRSPPPSVRRGRRAGTRCCRRSRRSPRPGAVTGSGGRPRGSSRARLLGGLTLGGVIAVRRDRRARARPLGARRARDGRGRCARGRGNRHAAVRVGAAFLAPAGERGLVVELPAVGLRRRFRLADRRRGHDVRHDRGRAAPDRRRRARPRGRGAASPSARCLVWCAVWRCCSRYLPARCPRSYSLHRRFEAWREPVRRAVIGVELAVAVAAGWVVTPTVVAVGVTLAAAALLASARSPRCAGPRVSGRRWSTLRTEPSTR